MVMATQRPIPQRVEEMLPRQANACMGKSIKERITLTWKDKLYLYWGMLSTWCPHTLQLVRFRRINRVV
jgi:hypothetical protein